jgi:hypothetical protein
MSNLYGMSVDTTSPTFAPLTDDAAILRQWVDNVLQTSIGFYWSSPETGKDIVGLVLKGLTTQQLAALPTEVQAALTSDQRIASADVASTTTFTAVGAAALKLTITVYPKDSSVAPFSLDAVASSDVLSTVLRGLGGT